MDLETVLGALEAAQRAAARPPRGTPIVRDPGALLLLGVRHAVGRRTPGAGASKGHHVSLQFTVVNGTLVAALAVVLRHESRPKCAKVRRRACAFSAPKRTRPARCSSRSTRRSGRRRSSTPRRRATSLTMDKVEHRRRCRRPASAADALNAAQRDLLMKLIDVYTGYMAPDIAADRAGEAEEGGRRQDRLRLGRRDRARQEALLPRAGADVPHRVRQHAERRQSRPLGVARLQRRLRPGPAARAPEICRALTRGPGGRRHDQSASNTRDRGIILVFAALFPFRALIGAGDD